MKDNWHQLINIFQCWTSMQERKKGGWQLTVKKISKKGTNEQCLHLTFSKTVSPNDQEWWNGRHGCHVSAESAIFHVQVDCMLPNGPMESQPDEFSKGINREQHCETNWTTQFVRLWVALQFVSWLRQLSRASWMSPETARTVETCFLWQQVTRTLLCTVSPCL